MGGSYSFGMLLALALGGPGDGAVAQLCYDTPESVFLAAQKAGDENRTLDMLNYLTPDSLEMLGTTVAFQFVAAVEVSSRLRTDDEGREDPKLATIKHVLASHGLTEAVIAEMGSASPDETNDYPPLERIRDHITDYPSLLRHLLEHATDKGKGVSVKIGGELRSTTVEGDTATAVVVEKQADGAEKRKTFTPRRNQGQW